MFEQKVREEVNKMFSFESRRSVTEYQTASHNCLNLIEKLSNFFLSKCLRESSQSLVLLMQFRICIQKCSSSYSNSVYTKLQKKKRCTPRYNFRKCR